jgi:hypothetical protein
MQFLTDLIQKIKNMFSQGTQAIEQAKYKAELLKSVASAMSDGQLTRQEVMEIVRLKDRLGISDADLAAIGGDNFVTMFNKVRDGLEAANNLANETTNLSQKLNEVQNLVGHKSADEIQTLKVRLRHKIIFATTDDELTDEEILEIVNLQQEAGVSEQELFTIGGESFAQMFRQVREAQQAMEATGVK